MLGVGTRPPSGGFAGWQESFGVLMHTPRMLESMNRSVCKLGVIAAWLLVCAQSLALKAADAPSPLRTSDNGRMLVDVAGKPVFVLADTAWSLAFRLSREDAEM